MHRSLLDSKLKIGNEMYKALIPEFKKELLKEYNIFLVGGDIKEDKYLRGKLQEMILKKNHKIKIHYPENIFKDQIFQDKYDLLSLENLLAKSVDSVIMCVESPGSFTELGAFSNVADLNNKLIVYMNEKHRYKESFINLGPIKYLRNKTKAKVKWINYEKFNIDANNEYLDLLKSLREMKARTDKTLTLENPFVATKFLLSLLYVFEFLARKEIIEIVKYNEKSLSSSKIEDYITTIDATVGILLYENAIYKDDKKLFLTDKGKTKIFNDFKKAILHKILDNYRFKMLNLQLRKYWGS